MYFLSERQDRDKQITKVTFHKVFVLAWNRNVNCFVGRTHLVLLLAVSWMSGKGHVFCPAYRRGNSPQARFFTRGLQAGRPEKRVWGATGGLSITVQCNQWYWRVQVHTLLCKRIAHRDQEFGVGEPPRTCDNWSQFEGVSHRNRGYYGGTAWSEMVRPVSPEEACLTKEKNFSSP